MISTQRAFVGLSTISARMSPKLTVRRVVESHGLEVFSIFARAEGDAFHKKIGDGGEVCTQKIEAPRRIEVFNSS